MASWPIQGTHDRLAEVLETTLREGPQTVTKDGIDVAVVVPITEWRRITGANDASPRGHSAKYGSMVDWLLAPEPKIDNLEELIGPRGRFLRRRPPVEFD